MLMMKMGLIMMLMYKEVAGVVLIPKRSHVVNLSTDNQLPCNNDVEKPLISVSYSGLMLNIVIWPITHFEATKKFKVGEMTLLLWNFSGQQG
jgi:hypothetical protein